jgi:hypothetical protein
MVAPVRVPSETVYQVTMSGSLNEPRIEHSQGVAGERVAGMDIFRPVHPWVASVCFLIACGRDGGTSPETADGSTPDSAGDGAPGSDTGGAPDASRPRGHRLTRRHRLCALKQARSASVRSICARLLCARFKRLGDIVLRPITRALPGPAHATSPNLQRFRRNPRGRGRQIGCARLKGRTTQCNPAGQVYGAGVNSEAARL